MQSEIQNAQSLVRDSWPKYSQLLYLVKSAKTAQCWQPMRVGAKLWREPGEVAAKILREPPMKSVGERIRFARKASDLTQEQLASKSGVTKGAVSQWEQGVIKSLNAISLFALADALEVNARWIAMGDRPPTRPAHVTPEESDLLVTFRSLNAAAQEELLSKAHEYQRITNQAAPSRASPYPHKSHK